MAVKTLLIGTGRRVLVESPADNKRACLAFNAASIGVTDDKCPHRGGPLHLCVEAPDGKKVCPWHGRSVKERPCTDFAVVYHPRDGRAVIVSDHAEGVPWPIRLLPASSDGGCAS